MNPISIFILIFCVVASAYFSATETAFTSLNSIRIRNMADAGDKGAQRVLRISENFDALLSTILIGNNIVNILFASVMTVEVVRLVGEQNGATLSTLLSTVILLIFAEVSPKSVAKERPERFALFSAPLLSILMKILTPFNWLFSQWKRLLSRIFRAGPEQTISEQEFISILEEVEEQGTIDSAEGDFIRAAVTFTEIPADAVMTPRPDVVAIRADADLDELRALYQGSGYSRIPVYEEDMDHIIGLVHVKRFSEPHIASLEEMIEPCLYVPENTKINRLLQRMQREKTHLAVVLDEYGGTAGIITLEDILEELIGEIWDESDDVEEEFIELSPTEYRFSGGMSIDKFFRIMNYEEDMSSSTLSGWVTEVLDHFPNVGDTFEKPGFVLQVETVDRHRVLTVHVTKKEIEND